jgi:hypothetical protein
MIVNSLCFGWSRPRSALSYRRLRKAALRNASRCRHRPDGPEAVRGQCRLRDILDGVAVRVLKHSYSVSSRLIGHRLRVRLHADIVELDHRGQRVAVMDRLIGSDKHRIDYRHIIHALVRKPGAFRRYVFREALFPSLEFRRAYDALVIDGTDQADLDYVRILHLAASDGEERVRVVLAALLAVAIPPTYEAVRAGARFCPPLVSHIMSAGQGMSREGLAAGLIRAGNATGALKASSTIRVILPVRLLQPDLGKLSCGQFGRLTMRLSDAGER